MSKQYQISLILINVQDKQIYIALLFLSYFWKACQEFQVSVNETSIHVECAGN